MQTVQMERGIKLLDSPGIIFDRDGHDNHSLALRNVLKVADLTDPVLVAGLIFQRVAPVEMCKQYKLPPQEDLDFQQFLVQLAMVSGRLLKAGIVDVESTARMIIQDWNSNRLPFCSDPPKVHESSLPGTTIGESDIGSSMIIKDGFAPAFDLDGLFGAEADSVPESNAILADEDEDLQMQNDNGLTQDTSRRLPKRVRLQQDCDANYEKSFMAISNPLNRKLQKKLTKQTRKTTKRLGRSDGEIM